AKKLSSSSNELRLAISASPVGRKGHFASSPTTLGRYVSLKTPVTLLSSIHTRADSLPLGFGTCPYPIFAACSPLRWLRLCQPRGANDATFANESALNDR